MGGWLENFQTTVLLTAASLGIPLVGGELALGAWQGVFLWEHRTRSHRREVVLHLLGD